MIAAFAWMVAALAAGSAFLVAANVLFWPCVRPRAASNPVPVSVLIPARNEERSLDSCIESVLAQGSIVAEVLVYNDHSTDNTPAVVVRWSERDRRVRAIETLPLPEGWCGKNFACFRLAQAAASPWLLFLDADARLLRGAVATALDEAKRRHATMLSLWPRIEACTFWESVLMPMLNFVVLGSYPAALALRRDDRSLGLAHGACILVHRDTYRALGGHEVVRDEIFEDTRLARAWRSHGRRSICLDGQNLVRVRMYQSFSGIWHGFQKNFFTAFQSHYTFWAFLLLHAIVFWLPFVAYPLSAFYGSNAAAWGLGAATVLLSRALLAIHFRQPLWSVLFHPVAESLLLALGIASWWRCVSGKGVTWKGRAYRAGASGAAARRL